MTNSELEIKFGAEITGKYDNGSGRYVIVDLGIENYFYVSKVIRIKDQEALGIPGTSYIEDVDQVIEIWTLDRIIAALEANFGVTVGIRQKMESDSQIGSRVIPK